MRGSSARPKPTEPRAHAHVSLPLQLTSFVGRAREAETLCSLLANTRLLSVTGAGGSGKTRLALEVAARTASSYADGVDWIELAALVDARHVASHIATALGIREDAAASTEEALVGRLRDQTRLLVLDNCEHVVDTCAQLVGLLLRGCPNLTILVTSREALGIAGERTWLVPPLSLPSADEASSATSAVGSEAVRLFVERARDVASDFAITDANAAAIVRICERVDGLPLGIELAAARVRVLPPDQIASRLDESFRVLAAGGRDALPRHRTLRAAIDWSYDLLSETERELLCRLTVFAGGFSLEAAEQVCAGDRISTTEVLDLVTELVDKSLVAMQEKAGVARYRLLEAVREYASDRLQQRGQSAPVHRRHAEFFREFAATAEPHAIVGNATWLDRLDAEADNCRAALAWSHTHGHDAEVGLELASALIWYWYHRNRWREGSQALELALNGAANAPSTARARALHGTGIFANYVGELAFADSRLREAELIWRAAGEEENARWLAFALIGRSTVALATNRPEDAERFADESVRVARLTGNSWDAALAAGYALMAVKVWRQDWSGADALLADAERVFRARRYAYGLAFVLDARAYVALQLAEYPRSAALAVDALGMLTDRPDHWLASRSARVLAAIAAHAGQSKDAARLLGIADGMLTAIGARALTSEREGLTTVDATIREKLPDKDFEVAYQTGAALTFRDATAFAIARGSALGTSSEEPAQSIGAQASEGIRQPHLAPPRPHDERTTPALEARTLGPLELLRNGTRIAPDAWRYAKPRELLLYLLVHPAGRTRDHIGVVFWPEGSTAQVKNNFHVTLHQLRQTLGTTDLIVFDGERYVINWALGVEVDAQRFEDDVRSALRMRDGALPVLERALGMYAGDFLDGAHVGDWHIEHRERLQRLYIEGLLALGELLSNARRHDDAADAYRKVLARDDLHEEAHRRLITALARSGRRSDALKQYDRLAKALERELGAEPETATIALFERLRAGTSL